MLNQEKGGYVLKSGDCSILCTHHPSFGRSAETNLRDINLEVSTVQALVVTGPVGCGKSLLLQAILGEIELKTGSMNVGGIGLTIQTLCYLKR